MKNSRYPQLVAVLSLASVLAGCSASDRVAGSTTPADPSLSVATASVTAIDISNGITGGGGRTISSTGIILGRLGSTRGWWQSPSPLFTGIDNSYVQGGNRNADAGSDNATALLSTNGGAPWTSVTLAPPPGIGANATLPHDINDARVVVGNTLGSNVYAIRWDTPSAIPVRLPMPTLQYPADQVVARSINNHGVIVGSILETLPKKKSRFEAVVWAGDSAFILPQPPGVTSQFASNINDAGVIAGTANGSNPIRWTPRTGGGYDIVVSTLDMGDANIATGINSCGLVAGGSQIGAWVWDGVSAPVILPGLAGSGRWGQASDINDSGTVVGSSWVGTSRGTRVVKATMWIGLPACTP